jgi:heme-degrading monooxygenase HmoA
VRTIPGFVEAKGYKSDDGDEISLVTFASREALRAWREEPEHLEAQHAGRQRFYARYEVQVCAVERAYSFSVESGRSA